MYSLRDEIKGIFGDFSRMPDLDKYMPATAHARGRVRIKNGSFCKINPKKEREKMVVMQYQVVIASVKSEPLQREELRELLEQILDHTGGDYLADVVGSWPDLEYNETEETEQGESTGEAGQPPRLTEADVRPDEVDKVDEGEPSADVSLDIVDGIKCRVAQVGAPMSFCAFAEMCKRAGIPARRVAKCAGLTVNQWNYAHRTARFSDDVADKLRQTYGVELIRKGAANE
jgi:hypothetical protein